MTPTLLVLALAWLAGLPVSLLLDRQRRPSARAGESLLFGAGVVWCAVMLLALTGAGWSGPGFIIAMSCVVITLWAFAGRRLRNAVLLPRPGVFDLLTLAIVIGYILFATAASPWEFDYLTDFGLKARAFWEHGGIDWGFLQSVFIRSFHADYPLLLPSLYDAVAMVSGAWNDRFLGLLNVAFGVAAVGVVRSELADEVSTPRLAALATAAITPLLLSPWIGMADGPLCAYITVALLRLRRSLRAGEVSLAGVILLGLGACTKNEGVAMIAAAAIALFVMTSWRAALRLGPAVLMALPWMILARIHGLGNDLAEGSVADRVLAHLRNPESILRPLANAPVGKSLMWAGLLLGAIVCGRLLVRERFTLAAIALQFVFYLSAYLTTPHDTEWHVHWSWERVVSQIVPTLVCVFVVTLLAIAFPKPEQGQGLADATAPSTV